MSVTLQGTASLDAPFPGLRAFEAEESLLFYGRETHVAELLERLSDSRFMAVTGTSGSGKSSLVRAGLRPALHRGYLLDATSRWRFATMRPGSAPIEALAESLASALGTEPVERITRSLRATSAGLSQVVGRAGLAPGESLLIIADQFEELFRFDVTRDQEANATLFVSLLLEATEQRQAPIYVVVTMRSEFLGRSSEFTGLAEAFNRSQYLVPRLTRDERREAIERPLKLFGTTPSPALVQQVLNDTGDDPDQLPVLQHVLLRTYRAWERAGGKGRLERDHYDAVGGIERALDAHGDEIVKSLSGAAQKTTERIFRSLTVAQGGVALRRPRRMRELYAIAGAADPDAKRHIDEVITTFAHRDNSFLMLSSKMLGPETVVDITHESLIRKWKRLQVWVREETRSAEWYADLLRDTKRYRTREVSLWQDPELAGVQKRRADDGWTEAWAHQYRGADDPLFPEALSFLDESTSQQAQRQREEEEQRDRELRQAKALARAKRREVVVLTLVAVGAIVVAVVAVMMYRSAEAARQVARDAQAVAESAQADATNSRAAAEKLAGELNQLNALLEQERKLSASGTASAADRARLQQEIEAAKAQAQQAQQELVKVRQTETAVKGDGGAQLARVETLQQQLAAAAAERDKLQAQVSSMQGQVVQGATAADRAAALQGQLDDERRRAAAAEAEIARLKTELAAIKTPSPASPTSPASGNPTGRGSIPSTAALERIFVEGVRAYDLGDWKAAAASMQFISNNQLFDAVAPKEVRMSGTRFVPYAPESYLAAALFEMEPGCSGILLSALLRAEKEPVPPDLRTKLPTARKRCSANLAPSSSPQ
jgi:predicted  nucleic acid-binding Zn-ribbon protein